MLGTISTYATFNFESEDLISYGKHYLPMPMCTSSFAWFIIQTNNNNTK